MQPFLYIIAYAIISLFIAFILFKYLKSSASFKDKTTGYKAGGAIAGFIIVFGILFGSYMKLTSSQNDYNMKLTSSLNDYKSIVAQNERNPYTVIGKVKKLDNPNNEAVKITIYPPSSNGRSDRSGTYTIDRYYLSQVDLENLEFIRLSVVADGYADGTWEIPRSKIHIRYGKEITIDSTINLSPISKTVNTTITVIEPD